MSPGTWANWRPLVSWKETAIPAAGASYDLCLGMRADTEHPSINLAFKRPKGKCLRFKRMEHVRRIEYIRWPHQVACRERSGCRTSEGFWAIVAPRLPALLANLHQGGYRTSKPQTWIRSIRQWIRNIPRMQNIRWAIIDLLVKQIPALWVGRQ